MVSSKNQKTSRAQKAAAASTARPTAPKPAKAKADYSLEDLLDKVGALAEQMEYPLAIKFAKRATEIDPEGAGTWEVLGSLYAETGETERGREAFEKAAKLEPDAGSSKFLYLGQLTTGTDAIAYFEKGVALMEKELEGKEGEEREEATNAIAGALCGMVELYMTDLCDEPDAEQRCVNYTQMALSHAPNSPEPHQLHASLLVTQRRKAEALQALERSISLWKDKDPQDWPEFGFRLESAKLMTELGDHDRAITMFEALRDEADEVMDAWYYLGWTWYLKGKGGPQETEEDMEMPEPVLDEEGLKRRAECWEEARLAFKMVLKLYGRIDIPVDEEMSVHAHAKQLLQEISAVLPPQDGQEDDEEMDDGWEDVEDGAADEAMDE